jgi:hypothetical protein
MIRGGFDKEARRKAQALAADAMSLWRLNQSTPVISYLVRSTKADEARSAIPYTPSMAQSSVRGACGFVLVGKPHLTPQRLTPTTSCGPGTLPWLGLATSAIQIDFSV